jgi:FAD:protein FMN transferase
VASRAVHPPSYRPSGRCRNGSRSGAGWIVSAVAISAAALAVGCSAEPAEVEVQTDGRSLVTVERELMKTRFRIDVLVVDPGAGRAAVEAAFAEVAASEELLSNWSESSQISRVNAAAGAQPVVVGDQLMEVLDRALQVSVLTAGAFDVTFASCDGAWSIRDRRIPSPAELEACLEHVDYRRVALDHERSAVFISDPETRVGIAGLAKGYRIDRAAAVLERAGIHDYVVDGGGDMRLATSSPDRHWEIALAHPRRDGEALGTLELTTTAVATSGDYQWFFELDGVRYHHILDPATGRPASRSVSATVLAERAVDADALATCLFVMGPDAGIELAESLPGVEALIIAPDLSLHATSGFPPLAVAPPEPS